MLALLYSYILSPKNTLKKWLGHRRLMVSLVVMALIAFPYSLPLDATFLIRQWIWMIIFGGMIFAVSVWIDTMAQLLKHPAKGLVLFQWLSMACLPLVLVPIVNSIFGDGLTWILWMAVIWLVVLTIRECYQANRRDVWIILTVPLMIVLVVISVSLGMMKLIV